MVQAACNLFIVEARQRIEIQKVLISNLEREERGTRSAPARLRRSEVMLQLLEDHREAILENVQRSLLPALVISRLLNPEILNSKYSPANFISMMIIRFRGFA